MTLDKDEFDYSNSSSVKKFIQKQYKFTKIYFFENFDENPCLKIIGTNDELKDNVSLYIEYFFQELSSLDVTFEKDKIESSIL